MGGSTLAGRVKKLLVKSEWLLHHLKLEFCYGGLAPEVEGSLHRDTIDTRDSNIRILESSDYRTAQCMDSYWGQGSYGELGVKYGNLIICLFPQITL